MSGEHRRTARLPHGYRVTFRFSPDVGLATEWTPHEPRIKSARAFRRFFEAYKSERDVFMRDIATMIGGPVLVADVGAPELSGVTTIKPEAVH